MSNQKQIKISVSEKLETILENKANLLGIKKSTYCYNIILEHVRREIEK